MDINKMEWPLSKEELKYLYWEEGMDQRKIAKKFNKTQAGVSYWATKHKLKMKDSGKPKKTTKKFKKEVYKLVGNKYSLIGEYKNNRTKIKIKHNECGHIYKVRPDSFLSGHRCPNCFGDLKKDTIFFKKEVKRIVNNKYSILGRYKNNRTKIKIKHNECGFVYKVRPDNFLSGYRCPKCAGNLNKDTKIFKKEVYNLVGDEYKVLGEYVNAHTKIKIKHNECGYIYKVTPNSFLNIETRCPRCSKNGFTNGEKIIAKLLDKNNIKNKWQFSYNDCKNVQVLPFDFKIKNKPIVIEYNGRQHYEPVEYFGGEKTFKYQQENDQIKKDFCQANNIKLITIPYWEKDNIEEILEEELMLD